MFATEAVIGGLAIHIAVRHLGHAIVTSTERYTAVFQDDLIRSCWAFLDRRRWLRPESEYREPDPAGGDRQETGVGDRHPHGPRNWSSGW
jgi:hypothetical protein